MASKSIKPCPVMEGNTTCGETETLAIINEFKTLYERKMHKIDSEAGGDNLPVLQAKIHLQKQWIRDLTAQNELLVRAVEELEKEATEKVIMLEGKLHGRGIEGTDTALDSRGYPLDAETAELLKEKEDALGNMSKQLQDKTDEVQAVRRSLLDMRSALTIEVAEKHDVILSLRRDVQEYEEKCRQSNKQTQFRDDIIKELRKEIKSLKEEECEEQMAELLLKIKELQDKLKTSSDDLKFKDANSNMFVETGSSVPALTMDTSDKNMNTNELNVMNRSSQSWNDTSKFMNRSSQSLNEAARNYSNGTSRASKDVISQFTNGSKRASMDATSQISNGSRKVSMDATSQISNGSRKVSMDATSQISNGSRKGSIDATSKLTKGTSKGSNDVSSLKFTNGSSQSSNDAASNIKKENLDNLETESLYILDPNSDSSKTASGYGDSQTDQSKLLESIPSESSKTFSPRSDPEKLKQAMIRSIDNILDLDEDTSDRNSPVNKSHKKLSYKDDDRFSDHFIVQGDDSSVTPKLHKKMSNKADDRSLDHFTVKGDDSFVTPKSRKKMSNKTEDRSPDHTIVKGDDLSVTPKSYKRMSNKDDDRSFDHFIITKGDDLSVTSNSHKKMSNQDVDRSIVKSDELSVTPKSHTKIYNKFDDSTDISKSDLLSKYQLADEIHPYDSIPQISLDSSDSNQKQSAVDIVKGEFSSMGNIPVSLVNKDDILSKYNSVNDIADIVEYIVDRTLSFAEKNELNFQTKVAGRDESPIEEDASVDWNLSRVRPITSTPKRDNNIGRADNLDREIAELQRLAENDCQLFLTMGRELDRLMRNSHEKDKQIENQKDMIKYLVQRLVLFHRKFHEMQRLQSRHKSMEVESDCNYIKKNIKKLDEENDACKEEVARLKAEIARLQADAQGLSSERDDFRRQSEDASKQISAMNEKLAKESEDTARRTEDHENEKANLQQENAEKSEELENIRRASTIMASDLNSDLDNERVERRKQSDQIASLSEENQRQHDKMQELYNQIKQLEESAGIVYCHCDDSDSAPTETKHVSINTDEFVSKAAAVHSDTSRAAQSDTSKAAESDTSRAAQSETSTAAQSDTDTAAETWLTTDSETKDDDEEVEEVEEIRILTVIEMTEHTITSDNGSGRIVELEEQLEQRTINTDNDNERIAELEEQLERRTITSDNASDRIAELKEQLDRHTITSDNASDRIAELKEQLERHTITSINANDRIAELEEQLARALKESEIERAKHNQEMNNLKQTIMQLEKSGQSSGAMETNAVKLYKNSVTLLEVSEERSNVEILQQRQTILNLQEALVSSKHHIEELQQKLSNEGFLHSGYIAELKNALTKTDQNCSLFYSQISDMDQLVEHLQDSNLELEVENFVFCQDIAILEARLLKYQHDFKMDEECSAFKAELVKLLEENKNQISANANLQAQLMSLTGELQEMQEMANEAKELQLILQKANEEMQYQANAAQGQLDDQIKRGKGEIGAHDICDCCSNEIIKRNAGAHQPNNLRSAQSDAQPCDADKKRLQGQKNASTPISPTDYGKNMKDTTLSCECGVPSQGVAVNKANVYGVSTASSDVERATSRELFIQETNFYEVSPVNPESSEAGGSCAASQFIICQPCTAAQYKDLEEESMLEMQEAIANKSNEINQFEDLLYNTQEKLDLSLRHNEDLQGELMGLISQIQDYEHTNDVGGTTTKGGSLCKQEIECCRDNLCDLKEKFYKLKGLLDTRNQQFCELQAKFQVQGNMCECLKQQLQGSTLHYENDICELKHNICDLNNKLIKTVTNYEMLQDEFKRSQALLVDAAMRETQLRKEQVELGEKLKETQQEEQKLCCCIANLKSENNEIIKSLNSKDRKYDLASSQVDELKSAAKSQLNGAHQEINAMKNEVRRLSQDRSSLKQQNDKLQRHICNLQSCTKQCQAETEHIREEMKQCMCDLNVVKAERDYLQNSYQKQRSELKMLHTAYANLNQDFQEVTELVIHFENELSNSKANENELRINSQNVLSNVKAWLEEQKVIKDELSQKVRSDEFEIFKLQHQVSKLETYECQCICECQLVPRQRGGANNMRNYKHANSIKQCQKIIRSLGSHGSESSKMSLSPDVTSAFEDNDEQECIEDYASKIWLNKVENMTQELQNCNKYWKNKLLDKEYVVSKDN